jgi:hypothetical protein
VPAARDHGGRDGPAVKVKERKERTEQQLLECPELVIAQLIEFKGKTSGTSSFIGTLRRKKSIEMKRLKGSRVSPEQTDWIRYLKSVGYTCLICHGQADAKAQVSAFMKAGEK